MPSNSEISLGILPSKWSENNTAGDLKVEARAMFTAGEVMRQVGNLRVLRDSKRLSDKQIEPLLTAYQKMASSVGVPLSRLSAVYRGEIPPPPGRAS